MTFFLMFAVDRRVVDIIYMLNTPQQLKERFCLFLSLFPQPLHWTWDMGNAA